MPEHYKNTKGVIKMKKYLLSLLTAVMVVSLAACGSKSSSDDKSSAINNNGTTQGSTEGNTNGSDANTKASNDAQKPETVTVKGLNGAAEVVEVVVPYDPQSIVVLDLAALDIIDSLGLGDRVVGLSDSSNVDYLKGYMSKDNIVNVGTVKEVDFEKIMACEPEVIFMGGRMGENYDALSEIAPVIRLQADTEIGVVESTRVNATKIASVFGKEAEVDNLFASVDSRIATLKEFAAGKTAVVGMSTSGGFNLLTDSGRCSIIGVEVGFENLGNDATASSGNGGSESANTSSHGNEASFELLVALKPDYIFVMDRDAAIATNGAKLAKEIMENELVMSTDAYKNGNLVILENPSVWYVAEGGINALSVMISDLENALIQK